MLWLWVEDWSLGLGSGVWRLKVGKSLWDEFALWIDLV